MRARGGTSAALSALLLFAVSVACKEDSSGTERVAYSNDDVHLPKPELKVVPTGAWLLSADFAWRTCGERACWAFDKRQHGGPDVFGVILQRGPRFTVQSASLRLRSSCGQETSRHDAVTGDEGVIFLIQDETRKKGSCDRFDSERDFTMASGRVEVLIAPEAGTPCGPLIGVESLFGHSYNDTGRQVKVNTGHAPDGSRIDWGEGDQTHQFQALTATPGIYDCSGVPK